MRYLRYLTFVLFLTPAALSAQNEKLEAIVGEGIALHDAGKYNEAIEKYKEALLIDSTNAMVYYEMAFSYHVSGDLDNALKYADKCLAQKGNESVVLNAVMVKGSIIDDRGNPNEAIKVYEAAMKDYPGQYLLLFNYGISLGRVGRREEAEAAMLQALQLKPSHPGSHLQLSTFELENNHRVKSMLGLYFFLMLENNTKRAADAYARLKEMFYKGVKVDDKNKSAANFTLVVGDKKNEVWNMKDLMVSLVAATSAELNKGSDPLATFASDTKRFFAMMDDIKDPKGNSNESKKDESKKKKKKKDEEESIVAADDYWANFYAPFFSELAKAGHAEAFSYYIAQAGGDDAAKTWLDNNKQKVEFFFLWVNNH